MAETPTTTESEQAKPEVELPHEPTKVLPAKDAKFVGRVEELKEIHAQLVRENQLAIHQQPVPHGYGGVGKTSLAVAYGWAFSPRYPGGVYFIDGGSQYIVTELSQLAHQVGIADGANQVDTARRVWRFLCSQRSLLIVDGLKKEEAWAKFLSYKWPQGACRVLLTTRLSWVSGFEMYNLGGLTPDEGVLLLSRYRADVSNEANQRIARDISERLDSLPLGLVLVGSYMAFDPSFTWIECAAKLEECGLGPVRRKESGAISVPDYGTGMKKFFSGLLDALPVDHQVALELASLLPEDHVMAPWLCELMESDEVVKKIRAEGNAPLPSKKVLGELLMLQLLRSSSANNRRLALHPFWRRELTQRLKDEQQPYKIDEQFEQLAKRRVLSCTSNWQGRASRAELSSLVHLLREMHDRGGKESAIKHAAQISPLLHRMKRLHDVAELLEPFVEGKSVNLLDPKAAAMLLSDFASSMAATGQYKAAGQLMQRVIAIDQKHLKEGDPTLAAHYSNFAGILLILKKFGEARRYAEYAARIEMKVFGKDDHRIGLRHWWLGDISLSQKNFPKAAAHYRNALEILTKHYPSDYPFLSTIERLMQKVDKAAAKAKAQ